MPERQRYRLRARSDREVIREVEPGSVYVDRDTGEEFEVVGKLLPLAPSPSKLPWAVENLRLCGCSLEQLTPKDVNDCVTCGRRLPAVRHDPRAPRVLCVLALGGAGGGDEPTVTPDTSTAPTPATTTATVPTTPAATEPQE